MSHLVCKFAFCRKEATERATLTSECGHMTPSTIPVCPEHSTPGRSPGPHICETCGQRVHMIRSVA